MPSVDNKVVSVKFDNADFQNKIGPTLQGLDKLKQGLNLDGQARSLDGLNEAGKRFNLDSIGQSVESISNKFSAMGAVAFSVLNNVTTTAINAGAQFIKAFTLDPVMSGFREFELQANSVQTILANTADAGTTLPQVTGALDNLNEYADKTIYNFGQMAKNIGTFTAAGVDLDTSTNAIKGIANISAMAGASAEQASGVMYQLSQAMSAGKVSAVDWISVTNAGIGGPLQKQLFEAAKALKTLNDVPIDQTFDQWKASGGNFREAMEKGVFTSDVLRLALSAMSGDMSKEALVAKGYSEAQADYVLKTAGIATRAATEVKTATQLVSTLKEAVGTGFATTFKKIIGDFEEAKTFYTGLSDIFGGIINRASEARNGMLEGWRFFGGREALIQSLRNVLWSLFSVIGSITKAFREVFPAMQPERLADLTKKFEHFTSKLIPSAETIEKIGTAFKGVFSVLKIGWVIISTVAGAFKDFFLSLNILTSGPGAGLSIFAKIGEGLNKLREVVGDGTWLRTAILTVLGPVATFINGISNNLGPALDWIVEQFNKIKSFFSKDEAGGGGAGGGGGPAAQIEEQINPIIAILDKLKGYFNQYIDFLKMIGSKIKEAFAGLKLDGNFQFPDFGQVLKVFAGGAGLGGFIVFVKNFRDLVKNGLKFDFGQKGMFDSIAGAFGQLTGVLKSMQMEIKAEVIKKIAIALAILTASVLVLSMIDADALKKALIALAGFFAALVTTLKALDEMISGAKGAVKVASISAGLVFMSIAVLGFVAVVKSLAEMDTDKMLKGVGGLAAMLAGLLLFIGGLTIVVNAMSENDLKASKFIALGLGLIAMAVAIRILASSVVELAQLDIKDLMRGLLGLAGIMLILAATISADSDKKYISMGIGLNLVAVAIKKLVDVVKEFANMEIGDLLKGIGAIGGILGTLALALRFFPDNLPSIGIGLFFLVRALFKMVDLIKAFAELEWETLIKGLIGFGLTLGTLAFILSNMNASLGGIAALVVGVAVLWVLYAVMKAFGELGLGSILVGIVAIAGTIGVLTLAAVLLSSTGAIFALLGLAAALLAIGASVGLVGLGILGIGAGIFILVKAIQLFQEIGITGIRAFLEMLPEIATAGAKAFTAFIITVLQAVPQILEALSNILDSVVTFLTDNIPRFAPVITLIISTVLQLMRDNVPNFINTGLELLIAFLTGIKDNIFQITYLVGEILIRFMIALNEKLPTLVDAGANLLITFLNGIASRAEDIATAVNNLIGTFLWAIAFNIDKVINAGGDLIANIVEGMGRQAEKIKTAGKNAMVSFLDSMADDAIDFVGKMFTVVTKLLNGLAEVVRTRSQELRDAGANLIGAIIDGMTGGMFTRAHEVIDAFKNVASDALGIFAKVFESRSPSRAMYRQAGYAIAGFVNGINADESMTKSMENLGNNAIVTLNDALRKNVDLANMIQESDPTIRPVLDLTNVKKGMQDLNDTIGSPVIDTSVSLGQASSLALATKMQEALAASESVSTPTSVTKDFKFEQNIYAPRELNMAEIYRQTKSQIAFAKEGLEDLTNENN